MRPSGILRNSSKGFAACGFRRHGSDARDCSVMLTGRRAVFSALTDRNAASALEAHKSMSIMTILLIRHLSVAPASRVTAGRDKLFHRGILNAHSVPVWECGAVTGFDSGEPRKRRKIDRITSIAVDRNSDCQFWKDSNQNWLSIIWVQ
jgi:hypothetical protein